MITNNIFIAMKAKIIRIIKSYISGHKLIIVPVMVREEFYLLSPAKKKKMEKDKMHSDYNYILKEPYNLKVGH